MKAHILQQSNVHAAYSATAAAAAVAAFKRAASRTNLLLLLLLLPLPPAVLRCTNAMPDVFVQGHNYCLHTPHLPAAAAAATRSVKMYNTMMPDVFVLGQKDYQQNRVVERLTRDLDFDVQVVEAPTIREPDGLAMSRWVYSSRV
jgi:hypothetical protein